MEFRSRQSNRRLATLDEITRISIVFAVVGTVIFSIWKGRLPGSFIGSAMPPSQKQLAAHNDEFCESLLRGPHTAEARKWFAEMKPGKPRTVGEFETTSESIAEIEAFYTAGAVRVMLVEIDDYGGMRNTGKLVITLPPEPFAREQVLARTNRWATQNGFDADSDNGQKYVYVSLD